VTSSTRNGQTTAWTAPPRSILPESGLKESGRHGQDPRQCETGAHHHGHLESVIYVLKGRAGCGGRPSRIRRRSRSGDFIFVPPYVPHQEINASTEETLECVLVRSDNETVVVNLDIEPVERPEESAGLIRSTGTAELCRNVVMADLTRSIQP